MKANPKSENDWDAYLKVDQANIPPILDLIEANASFDALETLQWMITEHHLALGYAQFGPEPTREKLHERVSALLISRYSADARITKICGYIGHRWDPAEPGTTALLEAVIERNTDPSARATAMLSTAEFAKQHAEDTAFTESSPDDLRFGVGKEADRYRALYEKTEQNGGSKALYAQAIRQFQNLISRYSAIPVDADKITTIGEEARSELDEINNFSVGSRPPEIVGVDLNGQPLSTESCRGKILVLSFWGSWCGPCMAMAPLERRFAAKIAGEPVVLIGVNSDAEAEKGRAVAAKEGMTWPSFWNGVEGHDGPISKAWHIRGWPTVYVIDQNGVVRLRMVGYGGNTERLLNETVDRLLMHSGS
jgi:thiol-disulfide isomerase/thioredoxin